MANVKDAIQSATNAWIQQNRAQFAHSISGNSFMLYRSIYVLRSVPVRLIWMRGGSAWIAMKTAGHVMAEKLIIV